MTNKTKWLISSVSGLILIGAGLSVFGEALLLKARLSQSGFSWFWTGTFSLILLNSGVSLVGQAVIFKIRSERDQKEK